DVLGSPVAGIVPRDRPQVVDAVTQAEQLQVGGRDVCEAPEQPYRLQPGNRLQEPAGVLRFDEGLRGGQRVLRAFELRGDLGDRIQPKRLRRVARREPAVLPVYLRVRVPLEDMRQLR